MKLDVCLLLLVLLCVMVVQCEVMHRCIHDDLVYEQQQQQLQLQQQLQQQQQQQLQQQQLQQQQQQQQQLGDAFGVSHQVYTSSSPDLPNANNTKPLRIVMDTRYLKTDTDYTCYTVGQVITTTDTNTPSFYTCKDADILKGQVSDYLLNKLLPGAVALLQSAFNVIPVSGNLRLNSGYYCGKPGIIVPDSYNTVGVPNADIVVFLTTRPITLSDVLAYAVSCQDDQYYRATAGMINISPKSISTDDADHQSQLGTIAHELTHVLGMTAGKWYSFRKYSNIKSGNNIITPLVAAFANDYFGCSNLNGAQLEVLGGGGTAGSHWEREQWMNEYMTGEASHNPVFSALTLSLFQDSGWYYMNFDPAQPLLWGNKAGCDFAKSCKNWPTGNGYACSGETNVPTFDLQAKGYCSSDPLTTCKYVLPYSNAWCTNPKNDHTVLDSGEAYALNSRLFTTTLLKDGIDGRLKTLGCYKTACVDNSTLKVYVKKFWYNCVDEARAISYGGAITCPKAEKICAGMPDHSGPQTGDVATSIIWPIIASFSPDGGYPGSTITIYGKNFYNITRVYIAGECTDINVLSPTELTAVLPDYYNIQNPTNLLKHKANVIVVNAIDNNDCMHDAYDLKGSIFIAVGDWLKVHYWITIAIVVGLVIIISSIVWCCIRRRRRRQLQRQGYQPLEEQINL